MKKKLIIIGVLVASILVTLPFIINEKNNVNAEETSEKQEYIYTIDNVDYKLIKKDEPNYKFQIDFEKKTIYVEYENAFNFYDFRYLFEIYKGDEKNNLYVYENSENISYYDGMVGKEKFNLGVFWFEFSVYEDNEFFIKFDCIIQDTVAPEIKGINSIEYDIAKETYTLDYIKSLVKVSDNYDEKLEIVVKSENFTGNEKKVGEYKILLSSIDSSLNISEHTVTVKVTDSSIDENVDNTDDENTTKDKEDNVDTEKKDETKEEAKTDEKIWTKEKTKLVIIVSIISILGITILRKLLK